MQINLLKAKMVELGLSNKDIAKALKISERTLNNRFNSKIFKSNEIEKLIIILKIENPGEVFFNLKIT